MNLCPIHSAQLVGRLQLFFELLRNIARVAIAVLSCVSNVSVRENCGRLCVCCVTALKVNPTSVEMYNIACLFCVTVRTGELRSLLYRTPGVAVAGVLQCSLLLQITWRRPSSTQRRQRKCSTSSRKLSSMKTSTPSGNRTASSSSKTNTSSQNSMVSTDITVPVFLVIQCT